MCCPGTDGLFPEILEKLKKIVANSIAVSHPNTAGHFHCAPLISALVAEVFISALNQSMDSFDQAPMATVLEQRMIRWLGTRVGFPQAAGGVFTSGGTQSNFMGLLLARDSCLESTWNWNAQKHGLPPDAKRLRILGSEVAHFSVEKSASQLGLGTDSVLRVSSDSSFRMSVQALRLQLQELRKTGLTPIAVVTTVGSTDFGSIDPLAEIAEICHSSGIWLHVDAAYGGALLFSTQYRHLLKGIENADSVGIDFHKLFWQPISCSAFLLRDANQFRHMALHADYLNPESHEQAGIPNLVTTSIATTRRFDALKLWVSLQALGERKLGQMIDRTFELATAVAHSIRRTPQLELFQEPRLGCVLFRYRPEDGRDSTELNATLRHRLFERGIAVLGHTRIHNDVYMKLTCMNPAVDEQQYAAVVNAVVEEGRKIESEIRLAR
jgi:L-2,4-diaminobutyrate decarboxylase